jgi:hypothetical protein
VEAAVLELKRTREVGLVLVGAFLEDAAIWRSGSSSGSPGLEEDEAEDCARGSIVGEGGKGKGKRKSEERDGRNAKDGEGNGP